VAGVVDALARAEEVLGRIDHAAAHGSATARAAALDPAAQPSEIDAKLAQKLDQLQRL
jgi:hypothetical protein